MSVSLRQIKGFVEVCRRGNFTTAASHIGVTQSGLSLLVQSLERGLGTQLLERGSRSLTLTEAGQTFLPIAERILDDVDLAVSATREPRSVRGQITVAALPTLAAVLVAPAIAIFRQSHAGVVMHLRDLLTSNIVSSVRNGDAHIGIGAFLDRADDVVLRPLVSDRLVAYCRRDLFGAAQEMSWRDLAGLPLITMDRDSNIRGLSDQVFAQLRLAPRPAYEVRYIATATALAHAGLGVAIIPKLEAQAFLDEATQIISLENPPIWREIGVLSRKNAVLAPYVEELIVTLERTAEGLVKFRSEDGP
ncbi:MAG TPA: LysR family transcriptional regulator [Devosia sp.]|nr:LysR family transcriptional regulator [Devosia sp.]